MTRNDSTLEAFCRAIMNTRPQTYDEVKSELYRISVLASKSPFNAGWYKVAKLRHGLATFDGKHYAWSKRP